jgi:hypothetical protein
MYTLDEGKWKRVGSGMGLFLSVGHSTGRRFGRNTKKWATKCVYCICTRTVYAFPPAAEICAGLAGSFRQ